MFNLDTAASKNDSKTWPYRMLIIGPSGSRKTNALFNLILKDKKILLTRFIFTLKT